MSPQFGSTNSLTPATQLAKMKLASCTNINVNATPESQLSFARSILITHPPIAPKTKQEVGGEEDEEDDDDDNDAAATSGGGGGSNNNGSGGGHAVKHLVAPMSVQPMRKAKCSTLSMDALRRL